MSAMGTVKSSLAMMIAMPHQSATITLAATLSSDGTEDAIASASHRGNLRISPQTLSLSSSTHEAESPILFSRALEYFDSIFGYLPLPRTKDKTELGRSSLHATNRGVSSEEKLESLNRERLTSFEKGDDNSFYYHERRLNTEVRMWYVDWQLMTCVQDCPTEGEYSRATCGGYAHSWEPLWSTADLCCQVHLSWQPREQCTKLGRPEYLDLDEVWGRHRDGNEGSTEGSNEDDGGDDFDVGDIGLDDIAEEAVELDEEDNVVLVVVKKNQEKHDKTDPTESSSNKVLLIVQGVEEDLEEIETELREWTVKKKSPDNLEVVVGEKEKEDVDKDDERRQNYNQSRGKGKNKRRNPKKVASTNENKKDDEQNMGKNQDKNSPFRKRGSANKRNPNKPSGVQHAKEKEQGLNGREGNTKPQNNLTNKGHSSYESKIDKVLTLVDGHEVENKKDSEVVFRKRDNDDDMTEMSRCWRSGTPCDTMAEEFACCTICSEGYCL